MSDENKEIDKVITIDINKEMQKCYIDYAMSVIVARALPDVRDGLKPVQRRILYSMNEMNLDPNKGYRKSARIVGDTMGKYHPHGDSSIYQAMVRMAQNFSMRYMLVDGHGNFGSIDGYGAAASRYTEARMSKITAEMLADIEKDTVDFVPNYDENEKEPTVLPARIPNLLVNGSSGIAVGMATNIPPHNLGEVIDGVVCMIENKIEGRETDVEELMQYIKGPDFPTGANILGKSGIRAAYRTGRGKIIVRSTAEIETHNGRERIVITEIPYMVNKLRLLEKIGELAKEKRVEGISDLNDASAGDDIKIIIDIKKDYNANVILNQLYKYTSLQESFGANMLALVDGKPVVLNLQQMLAEYLKHQENVVTRRTRFDLDKAEKRAHILEGLRIAIDNIDEVIRIIRTSYDNAKERLMERFSLSDLQAQAILEMQLRRLQGLEKEKIDTEYAELQKKIAYYKTILADEKLLLGVIRDEITAIKEKYADERRTKLMQNPGEIDVEDLIEEETCVFTLSNLNYVKRTPLDTYKSQNRGGKGIKGMQTIDEDYIEDLILTKNHNYIMFFTNTGRVYRLKAYAIPEAGRTARGTAIVNLIQLLPGEKITAIISMKEYDDEKFLFMATRNGMVKKTPMREYANVRKTGLQAIVLRENDELIEVKATDNKRDIFMVTKFGKSIRFHETDVRVTGRVSMGVIGMNLDDGDEIIGMQMDSQGETLLVVSENGIGKRTDISEFPIQKRGGKGVLCYKIVEKTGYLVGAKLVHEDHDIMMITNEGIVIRISVKDISIIGRNTSGVKLMNIDPNSDTRIASIAKVRDDEQNPEVEDAIDEQETEEISTDTE